MMKLDEVLAPGSKAAGSRDARRTPAMRSLPNIEYVGEFARLNFPRPKP
jgi:hypothetical protein